MPPIEHLYVHVPFCARRCVYCDFSIAVRSAVPVDEYLAALDAEFVIRHGATRLELASLYFGGGTPSRLGPEGVSRLLATVRQRAVLRPDAEVTLEANPEDVTVEGVRNWVAAGVNRVSLGVQSFDDDTLRWMHRTHDAATARTSIQVLRDSGLANFSIDLIFAAPAAVGREWRRDLDVALSLDVPHVSVYGLTVESHTPLGRWVARADVTEATEDTFEHEFLIAHEALAGAGYEHYEVSNYARPGHHSRHNWAYWNRRTYGGVGPSAHEFDGTTRRWNVAPYAEWVSKACDGRDPVAGSEHLGAAQVAAEEVYLGLRTTSGVEIRDADERSHVAPWMQSGWACERNERLLLTPLGWLRLDALAGDLTHFRSRY